MFFEYVDETERKMHASNLIETGKLCDWCDNEMEPEEESDKIYWRCTCGNFEEMEI